MRDVTQWSKFAATNEAVATVDEDGRVKVVGHGGGAVTAWYSSKIANVRITSPYEAEVPDAVFAEAPRQNFIDELVLKQLQLLHLPPAPPADDATFIRRAFLDTIGKLPTADEVRAFLADQSPDKRDRLIDALLSREEFVDYWAYQWSDLLLVNGTRLRPDAVKAFYPWIRERVSENTPWDEFARQIVLARGSSFENGGTNFYALHQDPETMTENVSQAFLGLSIGCAKCHNHPLEKWTNDQYYAMANLFARVQAKGWGGDVANGDGARTLFVAESRRFDSTVEGRAAAAGAARRRAAGGRRLGRSPRVPGRLAHVAGEPVLRAGDHQSRVGQFLRRRTRRAGRRSAAVEPGQQRRAAGRRGRSISSTTNYDLKALMRAILQSAAYQRSSVPPEASRDDTRNYRPVLSAAAHGRGGAGRDFAGDRRADGVHADRVSPAPISRRRSSTPRERGRSSSTIRRSCRGSCARSAGISG